jgi:hypothetical protein
VKRGRGGDGTGRESTRLRATATWLRACSLAARPTPSRVHTRAPWPPPFALPAGQHRRQHRHWCRVLRVRVRRDGHQLRAVHDRAVAHLHWPRACRNV